jgi:ACS family tartrate transporter-like MFS transporter
MENPLVSRAVAKVRWRLVPFLMACYFAAYLDRVNIGFAALTMNKDLGIGPEAFGFIAGIFFVGYCLFEVPSNVLLARFGARIWIARIMIMWGLVSMTMALSSSDTQLMILRFLLGVAEAGFFPGILFYLTRWVPAAHRASIVSSFMMAIPLSNLFGAPLSGWILDYFNGVWGLAGWQWLFVLESVPSIVLGIVAIWYLTEQPSNAKWLTLEERDALQIAIAEENAARDATRKYTLKEALTDHRILALSVVCFGIGTGLYGLGFWLPQIVQQLNLSNTQTGFVSAVPYLIGAIGMYFWGRHSDRTGERVWHVAGLCFLCGAVLILGAFTANPIVTMVVLTIASMCTYASLPVFWTLPAAMLTGTAAAGGLALINSVGNSGGLVGPYLIGLVKAQGLESHVAIASMSIFMIASGLLVLWIGHAPRPANGESRDAAQVRQPVGPAATYPQATLEADSDALD